MSNLYKEDGWYRGPEKNWELEKYGFYPKGRGDLIYNNLRKIIEDNDKSKWAYDVFDKCIVLLIQGKRWPDEMEPDRSKYRKFKRYGSQHRMSRDPWVMFYAACIHLDKREFIHLKPQWMSLEGIMYRPNLWELRKALLGKKHNYIFFRRVNNFIHSIFGTKDFVDILDEYRNWSYDRR